MSQVLNAKSFQCSSVNVGVYITLVILFWNFEAFYDNSFSQIDASHLVVTITISNIFRTCGNSTELTNCVDLK